jgi:hypothetical protein
VVAFHKRCGCHEVSVVVGINTERAARDELVDSINNPIPVTRDGRLGSSLIEMRAPLPRRIDPLGPPSIRWSGYLPKVEYPFQKVDAGVVLVGEGLLFHPLAPLGNEDAPLLAESQKAEGFLDLSLKGVQAGSRPTPVWHRVISPRNNRSVFRRLHLRPFSG